MKLELSIQVIVFSVSFLIALISGYFLIPFLKRLKYGQTVRDDGPVSHYRKTGTPTIGGIIFLIPVLLIPIYFIFRGMFMQMIPIIIVTLGFGFVGFIDDYIKVYKKRKDGLYWKQKLFALLIVSTFFAVYVKNYTDIGTDIYIPFTNIEIPLGMLFIPFTVLVLISSTNSVNITDGLDGLAAGITIIIMVFFTIVSVSKNEWSYIKIFSSIIAGGCLGFLNYNIYPARVFMGDTGSLALGGAIASVAIMMKMPLIILIIGLIFVVESLSVIIQVASYKLRKKRVFKMAPLHHHFELSGWKETRVVSLFWIFTVVLCIIGYFSVTNYI